MSDVSFLRMRSPADLNNQNYNETAVKIHPLPSEPSYFFCVNADPKHPERP